MLRTELGVDIELRGVSLAYNQRLK